MNEEKKTKMPYLAPECRQFITVCPAGIICQSSIDYTSETEDYDWVEFEM